MTKNGNTRQATTHTPEPWEHGDNGLIYGRCGEDDVEAPIICDVIEDSAMRALGMLSPVEEANARRIVAAVNACNGIGTEALESGIVADLRHVLGEIVTAADDLDAAIDGATDQFDAERHRLNVALRAAQAVLDGDLEINVHELLAGRKQIAAIWSVEDVQGIRPDLTAEQAWEVLEEASRKHDAEYGINWTTLECMADILFGPAPETDSQE